MARMAKRTKRDDFYVGYLPTPTGHRRALVVIVPALLLALVVGAAVSAMAQRDPGDAVWATGESVTVEGRLAVDPYPRVVTAEGSVLLVESGKVGAQARAGGLAGRQVRATGYSLTREGRTMLELEVGEDALVDLGDATQPEAPGGAETVVLLGEIVDSKCYHGAMKPGDGKSHKACAILCIRGGIPPALVVARNGGTTAYLLSGPDGDALGDWLLPFVGEPVEVRGEFLDGVGGAELRVREGDIRLW